MTETRCPLPKMARIRQTFARPRIDDIAAEMREQMQVLTPRIRPGMTVGLTVGSRGIQNILTMLEVAVQAVRGCGASPVLLAAMGSHGGGTRRGQKDVLDSLGITEERLGAPVITCDVTRAIGETPGGLVAYMLESAFGVDAIIPIATLAATTMATATEDNQIPVIYAAISDPGEAQLTGIANVTGTSDALNTAFILDMMLKANPDIETVGLLYSNSEANSVTPIREAKEYLDSKGIAYLEKTGNTTDEILTAASAMVGRVQAVFTPTDNVVMAAASAVAEILNEAGIPHYTGADSFVTAGAFATCGVNYTELGARTATLAYQAMTQGMDGMEDYYRMDGGIITVNTDTAAVLKADYSVFAQMAQLVEVTTTKD